MLGDRSRIVKKKILGLFTRDPIRRIERNPSAQVGTQTRSSDETRVADINVTVGEGETKGTTARPEQPHTYTHTEKRDEPFCRPVRRPLSFSSGRNQ